MGPLQWADNSVLLLAMTSAAPLYSGFLSKVRISSCARYPFYIPGAYGHQLVQREQ